MPLHNIVSRVEMVLKNIACVVPKGLFSIGPINLAGHLLETVLQGVATICMLGYTVFDKSDQVFSTF
jgi:hypothetical protein